MLKQIAGAQKVKSESIKLKLITIKIKLMTKRFYECIYFLNMANYSSFLNCSIICLHPPFKNLINLV